MGMSQIGSKTACRLNSSFLLICSLFIVQGAIGQGPPPANVVVSPVVKERVRDQILLIGIVESWRASTVASEVSGRVDALEVRRGQSVKRGQILARLATSDILLKLKEAGARRDATRARLERTKDILERSEKLMEGRAISEKDLRQARLTVEELEGDLAAIEAEILQLEDGLDKKTIRAPFSGVVTREETEIGEWVEEGGEIVHMVDLSRVRVLVDMPEQYVSGVKENEEVDVRIDALGRQSFNGKIYALIPEGNKEAHTFPLEVHVDNKDLMIKEGMLARVGFNLGFSRETVMVHKDAIITRAARSYVFIVNGEEAKQVFVTTGRAQGDLIEITGSVKVGEKAVIRGNERLRNGQPVQVAPNSEQGITTQKGESAGPTD
jgi:RND family efflux transporter MFP subunit